MMHITICKQLSNQLSDQLVAIWEASVRATHDFLDAAAIAQIKAYVPDALRTVPILVVALDDTQKPLGFMGVSDSKLEMLFVAPQARGRGVGKELMTFGIDHFELQTVVVNEQNPQAVGFYEHMGFHTVSRSELDEQGQAYPVLVMHRVRS